MRESQAIARRAGLLVLPLHGDLTPGGTGPGNRTR